MCSIKMQERNVDRYMSIKETCEYLGLNRNAIFKMISEDGLPAVKIGKLKNNQK